VTPEERPLPLLDADEVHGRAPPRQAREGDQRLFAPRLDERGVADERDPFEAAPAEDAARVERAAVRAAHHAVVADEPGHEDRVGRSLGQKVEHLLAVLFGERFGRQNRRRPVRGRRRVSPCLRGVGRCRRKHKGGRS
jgi:hypothetical protein